MKHWSSTLSIGIDNPFTLLHFSDTHLTLADERDDERKRTLAATRAAYFPCAQDCLREAIETARETGDLLVHTGDLIDFVSQANLDAARAFTAENDCFMSAGNHEFSLYVGEAWEDAAYRNQSLNKVQACFKNDIRFSVREVNGVNLVALDNSYYLIEEEQLAALKAVCAEGKPVILLMHTPLYAPDLCRECLSRADIAYLMAVPEDVLSTYNDHRRRQQTPDQTTLDAYHYILTEKNIRALLAGHLHDDFVSQVTPTLKQYVVGTTSLHHFTVN